ncbi:MAG: VOC family protein, partial [Pirellulales bacterium]|nr:VOC family protein [Pirellulales bacterium]
RSRWVAYVVVADIDAVTTKAKALRAKVDREPFDVPGVGRSAVIRDPQGAIICPHVPAHDFPPPGGTFVWDELVTDHIESAKTLYGELFGWKAKDSDRGGMRGYTVFSHGDDTDVVGAASRPFDPMAPAAWIPNLATDDLDATVARAEAIGASIRRAAIDVPHWGRCAVLEDPTGAMFGLGARHARAR